MKNIIFFHLKYLFYIYFILYFLCVFIYINYICIILVTYIIRFHITRNVSSIIEESMYIYTICILSIIYDIYIEI